MLMIILLIFLLSGFMNIKAIRTFFSELEDKTKTVEVVMTSRQRDDNESRVK